MSPAVEIRGLPLIHDKTVDEWGTAVLGYFMTGPPAESAIYNASGLNFIRHKDWLGSSRLATTWAHGVYAKEAYAPFGETYNEAGTPDRSFTGQDQDTTFGVYDYLFRKYDTAAGRWLSPDPSGWGAVSQSSPQSLNRYAYVQNNPNSLIDANGLDCAYAYGDSVSVVLGDCYSSTDSGHYIDCDGCAYNASKAFLDTPTGTLTFTDQNGNAVTDDNGDAAAINGYADPQGVTTNVIVSGGTNGDVGMSGYGIGGGRSHTVVSIR